MILYKVLYKVIGCHLPASGTSVGPFRIGEIGRKFRAFCFCGWNNEQTEKDINIEKNVRLSEQVTLGKRSGIGEDSIISGKVTIGDNVMIGPNVTLATPMHPLLPEERNIRKREDGSFYNLEYAKPITIKDNCWLASNVVVCGGVTIGEGCVIGAGSVVTRDIPPYSLAAGNPCRVIRKITEKDHMSDGIEKF